MTLANNSGLARARSAAEPPKSARSALCELPDLSCWLVEQVVDARLGPFAVPFRGLGGDARPLGDVPRDIPRPCREVLLAKAEVYLTTHGDDANPRRLAGAPFAGIAARSALARAKKA